MILIKLSLQPKTNLMNLVDAYVTKIISKPYYSYGKWWVDVEYDCYGNKSKGEILCNTEEEANKIKVGHKFVV